MAQEKGAAANKIILSRTADNKLAVQFPDAEMATKFLQQIGQRQHRNDPISIDSCTFHFQGGVSGNGFFLVYFASEQVRDNFTRLLGMNGAQSRAYNGSFYLSFRGNFQDTEAKISPSLLPPPPPLKSNAEIFAQSADADSGGSDAKNSPPPSAAESAKLEEQLRGFYTTLEQSVPDVPKGLRQAVLGEGSFINGKTRDGSMFGYVINMMDERLTLYIESTTAQGHNASITIKQNGIEGGFFNNQKVLDKPAAKANALQQIVQQEILDAIKAHVAERLAAQQQAVETRAKAQVEQENALKQVTDTLMQFAQQLRHTPRQTEKLQVARNQGNHYGQIICQVSDSDPGSAAPNLTLEWSFPPTDAGEGYSITLKNDRITALSGPSSRQTQWLQDIADDLKQYWQSLLDARQAQLAAPTPQPLKQPGATANNSHEGEEKIPEPAVPPATDENWRKLAEIAKNQLTITQKKEGFIGLSCGTPWFYKYEVTRLTGGMTTVTFHKFFSPNIEAQKPDSYSMVTVGVSSSAGLQPTFSTHMRHAGFRKYPAVVEQAQFSDAQLQEALFTQMYHEFKDKWVHEAPHAASNSNSSHQPHTSPEQKFDAAEDASKQEPQKIFLNKVNRFRKELTTNPFAAHSVNVSEINGSVEHQLAMNGADNLSAPFPSKVSINYHMHASETCSLSVFNTQTGEEFVNIQVTRQNVPSKKKQRSRTLNLHKNVIHSMARNSVPLEAGSQDAVLAWVNTHIMPIVEEDFDKQQNDHSATPPPQHPPAHNGVKTQVSAASASSGHKSAASAAVPNGQKEEKVAVAATQPTQTSQWIDMPRFMTQHNFFPQQVKGLIIPMNDDGKYLMLTRSSSDDDSFSVNLWQGSKNIAMVNVRGDFVIYCDMSQSSIRTYTSSQNNEQAWTESAAMLQAIQNYPQKVLSGNMDARKPSTSSEEDAQSLLDKPSQQSSNPRTRTRYIGFALIVVAAAAVFAVIIGFAYDPRMTFLGDFLIHGTREFSGNFLIGTAVGVGCVALASLVFIISYFREYAKEERDQTTTYLGMGLLSLALITMVVGLGCIVAIAAGASLDPIQVFATATAPAAFSILTWVGIAARGKYCTDDHDPPGSSSNSDHGRPSTHPTFEDQRCEPKPGYNYKPGQPANTASTLTNNSDT